ncbi:glycosyltransferase family 4 protein [Ornithinimicrobium sp. Arc0846-15]|nr:glycosyltransferase family 4 protein [Ornithinimicrobium laminariae]
MPQQTDHLRVLLVTSLVAGGIGQHVRQLARGLASRSQQISVAAPQTVIEQFQLHEFSDSAAAFEVGSRPSLAADRRALSALTQRMVGQDVVHAHGVRAGALAVFARRRLMATEAQDIPALVVTLHNAAPERGLSRVIHQQLQRVVAKGSDLILAVSPDLAAEITAGLDVACELAVVPAVPKPREDLTPAQAQALRTELGLGHDQTIFVTAARLTRQKGLTRLLEAVARLAREQGPLNARWLIAGDGPDRARLQARITNEGLPIDLLGHRTDVPSLLALADVAVSAARWEGQPVWIQEALHAGCAIVATNVGGTNTVLAGAGWLVDGDDRGVASGLRYAFAELLADPREQLAWAERARARSGQLPTADDALDAVLLAYGSVGAAI